MSDSSLELPRAVRELAMRLGAGSSLAPSATLTQTGRMKRGLGSNAWMSFSATQTISAATCDFAWRARFGPLGIVSVCDALQDGVGRLDVTALGMIPIARTARTPALTRGELMRYLAELAWIPDAILANRALRWREDSPNTLVVGAGQGTSAVEVTLTLDGDGRIAKTFAPDRPRSATDPILPTPWRGRLSDYRRHLGRWIPFGGEVGWEIGGKEEVYWQGQVKSWAENSSGAA
ncbi:MAG: hypothetical protein JWQ97_203 [Phenylobacterium sp.]|nr:hypothetical protein [Phenylobacterium sp.]